MNFYVCDLKWFLVIARDVAAIFVFIVAGAAFLALVPRFFHDRREMEECSSS